MDESVLEKISQITELNDLHEFLQDNDVDKALEAIIKIIAKPDVPPKFALMYVVQLQALASKFGIMANELVYLKKVKSGSDEYIKKSIYLGLEERINRLVDALKYICRG